MQKNDTKKTSEKRKERFVYAFAISLLFLFFALFPDVDLTIATPQQAQSLATLVEKDTNKETIGFDDIQDNAPLFIPTRWNVAPKETEIPTPVAWNFETSINEKYASELENPNFPMGEDLDENDIKFIRKMVAHNVFSGYARAEQSTKKSGEKPTNKISYSIIDLSTGNIVKSACFEYNTHNKTYSIPEYKVTIEKDGWVMRPIVIQSSGDDDFDNNLAKLLTKSKLLKQIPYGDYKVIFVP